MEVLKLRRDGGGQRSELYHLQNDLGETKNAADENPKIVEQLMAIAEVAKGS